jgi:hypothetical protein
MMAFQDLQRQFLAHLRNPEQQPLPTGFDQRGTAIYVDLLYNKFNDSLTTCFPVMYAILGETAWQRLLKDFIAEHRCLSPFYRQIPDEFMRYLQNERQVLDDLPFLPELAHFEWIELVLSIAEAEPVVSETLTDTHILDAVLVFAPVMKLLYYVWPVQQINQAYQPDEPTAVATHILGFRDAADQVRFISLNPAAASLLMHLQNGHTATQVLQELGKDLKSSELSNLMLFGKNILADLYHQGAIIGINIL